MSTTFRNTALVAALAVVATACTNPETALQRLTEARGLSSDLLVQFTKTADAGNRAVMADTDEASAAFAREAQQTMQAVRNDIDTLNRC